MRDYLDEQWWLAKLDGARLTRPDLDDATAAYAHYMDGSGEDLRVDYEEAYREDSVVRAAVDDEIATAQREAERIVRESGQTAFQMTGEPTPVTDPATENWQKTVGKHNVYGTSDVVVDGDRITMKIKVSAEDMYNFNAGQADIASGAPDDENGRFSTLGWAKEFRTYGEVERTVTWTIGEAPPNVSGGSGPERDVRDTHEDRGDGRGDG